MDRDPMDYLCTLQGENAQTAEHLRREARRLRGEADDLERKAAWHGERVAWLQAAIDALDVSGGVS